MYILALNCSDTYWPALSDLNLFQKILKYWTSIELMKLMHISFSVTHWYLDYLKRYLWNGSGWKYGSSTGSMQSAYFVCDFSITVFYYWSSQVFCVWYDTWNQYQGLSCHQNFNESFVIICPYMLCSVKSISSPTVC